MAAVGPQPRLARHPQAFALHVAGDQHLGSCVRYGIDAHDDAGFAFCTPAIGNTWPRRWFPPPDAALDGPLPGQPPYTGRFHDGFGNKITVHAVANPVASGHEPARLHDRVPGYGIVRLHPDTRKIDIECWPRWSRQGTADATPYRGWPITIAQRDNYGRVPVAFLPALRFKGIADPVVQVIQDSTQRPIYTLRIRGTEFRPWVFAKGTYTVRVGEPDTDRWTTIIGLKARPLSDAATRDVVFPR